MFSPHRPKPIAFQFKKLSAAVAMAMLFSQADAAGWGDLTVLSSLGQPLRADIELISVGGQEDGPLTVKLAGVDAYRRANIEFNPVLMSLRFAVEQRGGRQFVHVTSTQPVNEPFVDMLLELSSSNGRVVREYVFLLDPASADAQQVATVAPLGNTVALPARKPVQPAPVPARPSPTKTAASKPATPNTAVSKPRLTLSGVTATSATDDKAGVIALDDYATMEKQVAEANARVKVLEQKVNDLQKLLEVTNTLLAELQKQNEAAATAPRPAPQMEAAAIPATAPVAEARPAVQEAPAVPAPLKAAPSAPAAPKPVAPPEEETDYLIPGAALLAALLGAAGIYSSRRRKARQAVEAGFRDATRGDKPTISTAGDGATTALTTGLLLPTALGNTHEVDPLAEADVYIAYGRDVQAEDILKEALNKQPDRHAVRVKLLSIYAGRKDLQSFDALARELHGMTKGEGEDWQQAAELGREIAPANPLYAVKAEQPAAPEPELVLERVEEEQPSPFLPDLTPTEEISPVALEAAPGDVDFDLDNLDAQAAPLPAIPPSGPGPIDFDFLKPVQQAEENLAPIPELPVAALDEPKADDNLMDFDFLKPEAKAETVPELPQAALEEAKQEEALLDFDFLKPAGEKSEDSLKR